MYVPIHAHQQIQMKPFMSLYYLQRLIDHLPSLIHKLHLFLSNPSNLLAHIHLYAGKN